MFKIVILILVVALGLLILNHDKGSVFGINNSDFAELAYLAPIAALLSVGILAGRRTGFSTALKQIAAWLAIILVLVTGYTYRHDLAGVKDRVMANLIPGSTRNVVSADGSQEVLIARTNSGHFATNVSVDGQSISMLVDTGASSIVLSHEDAKRVGIDVDALNYSIRVSTANGTTTAAPIRLSEVSIGSISRRNVSALVSREGAMDGSLLGMTFLSTLSAVQIKTDELRLRD